MVVNIPIQQFLFTLHPHLAVIRSYIMSSFQKYNLVYITTSGEYKTPLAKVLLFEEAQYLAANFQENAPAKIETWIIGSLIEYFDIPSQTIITELSLKYADIMIRMINGISILNSFPVLALLKFYRKLLGTHTPVIYCCRGSLAAEWALKLKQFFPNDTIVIDLRQY